MITASAGSGKTYSLTVRFLRLLTMGAAPESIIALTFSRKAAGEFFNAILHRLAEAASDEGSAARLAADVAQPALKSADFLSHLSALVKALHLLSLSTFDSFFIRIARSFPFELGLAGEFGILDRHARGLEQDRVFARVFAPGQSNAEAQKDFLIAFQEANFGREETGLGNSLDKYVDEWHEYFLIAPGEECWGQEATIWPEGSMLARPQGSRTALLNAGREAAAALTGQSDKAVSKWNRFFDLMASHSAGTPIDKDMKDLLDKLIAVLPGLAKGEAEITNFKKVSLTGKGAQDIYNLVCHFIHELLEVSLRQTRGIYKMLALYDRHYHDMVRRQGKLTFQDVQLILSGDIAPDASGNTALTARRGQNTAARELIDYRLDARYQHWLLDEFQDTSRVQWNVLRNLCDEVIQDPGGQRSFFAVGDPKQSIHVWRGAEPGLFREILEHYNSGSSEAIETVPLHDSWRSGSAVVNMVNRLMGNKARMAEMESLRGAAALWPWQDHCPARERPGCAVLAEVPVEKGDNKDAAVWTAAAQLIRQLDPLRRGLSCAVLCHRNARARDIADILRKLTGMEVVCEADVSVATDNPACAAVLSLMAAGAHPQDDFAWQHVGMTPLRRIIEKRWKASGTTAAECWKQLRVPFTVEFLRAFQDSGAEPMVRRWMDALRRALPGMDGFSIARLEALCRCAQEWDVAGSRDVDAFLSYARDWQQREIAQGKAIQVMTLHKSKGLTFDVVILPDLHDPYMYPNRVPRGVQRGHWGSIEWITQLPARSIVQAEPVLARALDHMNTVTWGEHFAQLYVAVTRARYANYLLLPPESGYSGEAVTIKQFVRTMLAGEASAELPIGGISCPVLSLDGDLRWYEAHKLPEAARLARAVSLQMDFFADQPPDEFRANAPKRRIPLQRKRPSEDESDAGPFHAASRRAAGTGSLTHRLLGSVPWADAEGLSAFENYIRSRFPLPSEAEATAIASARAALTCPEFRPWLLPSGTSAEVWLERAYELVICGEWTSGIFDRVVIEYKDGKALQATVIEYKTDSRPSPDPASHSSQISAYRHALALITGLEPASVKGVILYTAAGKAVPCG